MIIHITLIHIHFITNYHICRHVNNLFTEEYSSKLPLKLSSYIRYIAIPILSLTSPGRPLENLLSSNVFSVESFAKIRVPRGLCYNDMVAFYEYIITIATYQPAIYAFLESQGIFNSLEEIRVVGASAYQSIFLLHQDRANRSTASLMKSLNCLLDGNQIFGPSIQIYCNTLSKSK